MRAYPGQQAAGACSSCQRARRPADLVCGPPQPAAELAWGDPMAAAGLARGPWVPQARAPQAPAYWRGFRPDALLQVESLAALQPAANSGVVLDGTAGLYVH